MEENNKKYEKWTIGWLREKLEEIGIDTKNKCFGEMIRLGQEKDILMSDTWNDHEKRAANKLGLNKDEYREYLARKKGFKDLKEENRICVQRWRLNTGKTIPLSESKGSKYKGIFIGEKKLGKPILENIFEDVIEMPFDNKGFEYICKNTRQEFTDRYNTFRLINNKEYKIDIKVATLDGLDKLNFTIRYNNVTDYFLFIGLKDINRNETLEIIGIWLIDRNEQIRYGRDPYNKIELYNRKNFVIKYAYMYLLEFEKYEITNELGNWKDMIIDINEE